MKSIIAYPKVQWFADAQACCLGRHDEERDRTTMSNSGKQERRRTSSVKIVLSKMLTREAPSLLFFLLWINILSQLSIPKGLSARSCQGHVDVHVVPRNLWNRPSRCREAVSDSDDIPSRDWRCASVEGSTVVVSLRDGKLRRQQAHLSANQAQLSHVVLFL